MVAPATSPRGATLAAAAGLADPGLPAIVLTLGREKFPFASPSLARVFISGLVDVVIASRGGYLAARLRLGAALVQLRGQVGPSEFADTVRELGADTRVHGHAVKSSVRLARTLADRHGQITNEKVDAAYEQLERLYGESYTEAVRDRLRDNRRNRPDDRRAPLKNTNGIQTGGEPHLSGSRTGVSGVGGVGGVVTVESMLADIGKNPVPATVEDAEILIDRRKLPHATGHSQRGSVAEARIGVQMNFFAAFDAAAELAARVCTRVLSDSGRARARAAAQRYASELESILNDENGVNA